MSIRSIQEIKLSPVDFEKGIRLPLELSEDVAYLSGILVGDGHISIRPEKYDYLLKCVGNPKDEKELYLDIIGPYFKRVFGFMPNIRYYDQGTTFGFAFSSKVIVSYFTLFVGLIQGKKNESLCIPLSIKERSDLIIPFIRGLFDTDGCISFKKRYKIKPYYPVISLSSQSKKLIMEVSLVLQNLGLKVVESLDYKYPDKRSPRGFNIINRIELNGQENLQRWLSIINFYSPKHLAKIEMFGKESSGERI